MVRLFRTTKLVIIAEAFLTTSAKLKCYFTNNGNGTFSFPPNKDVEGPDCLYLTIFDVTNAKTRTNAPFMHATLIALLVGSKSFL